MKTEIIVKILYKKIHDALITDWDPIGTGKFPDAKDEYDSYISMIYKMIISKKSEQEMFDYLWWVETEYMGLKGDRQHTENFVDRLLNIIPNDN